MEQDIDALQALFTAVDDLVREISERLRDGFQPVQDGVSFVIDPEVQTAFMTLSQRIGEARQEAQSLSLDELEAVVSKGQKTLFNVVRHVT